MVTELYDDVKLALGRRPSVASVSGSRPDDTIPCADLEEWSQRAQAAELEDARRLVDQMDREALTERDVDVLRMLVMRCGVR